MSTGTTFEEALRAALPLSLHTVIPNLAGLLADVVAEQLAPTTANLRLADPTLAPALHALRGQQLAVGSTGIAVSDTAGDVTITVSGIVGGRDVITLSIPALHISVVDQGYDVGGLSNPYLGLNAFTYADRAVYSGREQDVVAAVTLLTDRDAPRALLFVTGFSGSGKSSFVQAGLVPALLQHYGQRARWAIFRPQRHPLAELTDALARLGLPVGRLAPEAIREKPERLGRFVGNVTPADRVNILVLDQFEELFTQSEPTQRDAVLQLLASLPSFDAFLTHIIATLRADYLPELFRHKSLYATASVNLHAISEKGLRQAILRPIQQKYPAGNLRFEPALLQRLASDTAADESYLPLLQVTLEELWDGGSLTLSRYNGLADAISRRFNNVLAFSSKPGRARQPRPQDEQDIITDILLALVQASPDDDLRRDVRRSRSVDELARGNEVVLRLVDELCDARLLTKGAEERAQGAAPVAVVNIIHESLIANWDYLRQKIAEQRELLRQRSRFEQALNEWRPHADKVDELKYLLNGVRLEEAVALRERGDRALYGDIARSFLSRSEAAEKETARQLRLQLGLSEARRLAFAAGSLGDGAAETAVLLACEAVKTHQNPQSEQALRDALDKTGWHVTLLQLKPRPRYGQIPASRVLFSPDGERVLSWMEEYYYNVDIWSLDGQLLAQLTGHTQNLLSVTFSQDGRRILTLSKDDTARLWGRDGDLIVAMRLVDEKRDERARRWAELSPDGRHILTTFANDYRLWDERGEQRPLAFYTPNADGRSTGQGHTEPIISATFSPSGQSILTTASDAAACLWSLDGELLLKLDDAGSVRFSPDGQRILTLHNGRAQLWAVEGTLHAEIANIADEGRDVSRVYGFSADGQHILLRYDDGEVEVRTIDGQRALILRADEQASVTSAKYSPDGRRILTEGSKRWLWDHEGQLLATFSGDGSAFFSPQGGLLLVEGSVMRLFDDQGQPLGVLAGHTKPVSSVAFSPDGRRLASAQQPYGDARVWSRVGPPMPTLSGHTGTLRDALYLAGGRYIATTATLPAQHRRETEGWGYYVTPETGEVRLWQRDGQLVATLEGSADLSSPLTFSPDRRRLLTLQHDAVLLWELAPTLGKGLLSALLARHQGDQAAPIARLLERIPCDAKRAWFSPDGQRILAGNRLFDQHGTLLATLIGEPVEMPFSLQGLMLTVSGADLEGDQAWDTEQRKRRVGRLWNADGTLLTAFEFELRGGANSLDGMLFSPDGQRILIWEEHSVQLYDLPSGRLGDFGDPYVVTGDWQSIGMNSTAFSGDYKVKHVCYSPNGQQVLTTSTNEHNRGVKLSGGNGATSDALKGTEELGYDDTAGFSGDGSIIYVTLQTEVALYTNTGRRIGVLRGHDKQVKRVVFSRKGRRILTASADGTAKLWRIERVVEQLENGTQEWRLAVELLATFRGHSGPVNNVMFSPDERQVLSISDDGTVRQFLVHANDLLQMAAQRVGRELSEDEIERFQVAEPLKFHFERVRGKATATD